MKRIKGLFGMLLVLLMLLSLLPVSALADGTPIASVSVTITPPEIGATPDYDPVLPAGVNYHSDDYSSFTWQNGVAWYDESMTRMMEVETAEFRTGHRYRVWIDLRPNDGYTFSEATTATLNGEPALTSYSNGKLQVRYTFSTLPGEPGEEVIQSAAVTITPPEIGASPDYNPGLPAGAPYYSLDNDDEPYMQNDVMWYDVSTDENMIVGTDTFQAEHQYQVRIYLKAKTGYGFPFDAVATLNGQPAEASPTYTGLLEIIYTFPALPDKIEEIPIPSAAVAITPPEIGASPDYNPVLPAGTPYYSNVFNNDIFQNDLCWYDETLAQALTVGTDTFLTGHQYSVVIYLTANEGYAFSEDVTATVNDRAAEANVFYNGQLKIQYTFETLDGLEINETNFPDPNFRAYVANNFDSDGDGWLIQAEREAVEEIDCENLGIASLRGVEHFPELTDLNCCYNALTELDLSANTRLSFLNCSCNEELAELDLSALTELDVLYCSGCLVLAGLDLSANTKLTELDCRECALSSLSLGGQAGLWYLDCSDNELTALDLDGMPLLRYLMCDGNTLTGLDLSDKAELQHLSCENCQLQSLDLSASTGLKTLNCSYNALTALTLPAEGALVNLYCGNNALTSLDVSGTTELRILQCEDNALTALCLGEQPKLSNMYCEHNQLAKLDISACPMLLTLAQSGEVSTANGVVTYTGTDVLCVDESTVLVTEAPDHVPGDINGDGKLNNKDVTRLQKYLAGEEVDVNPAALDVNGDGKVNNKDLTRLQKYLKGDEVEIH